MLQIAENSLLALQIMHFLLSILVVYRPHPLYWHDIVVMGLQLSVGKGHQVITAVEYCNTTPQWLHSAWGMRSREL